MTQDKSTAGAAQRKRIVQLLRTRPHTSYELRRAGCYQAPTRVFELRNAGFDIQTTRVVVVDDMGYLHPNVALYALVAEPVSSQIGGVP
jgi:hypothetical protein